LLITAWSVWLPIRSQVIASPTERGVAGWWPFAVVSGTYLGLPLLFGPDSFTGKVVGMLAGLLGLTGLLAYSPTAAVLGGTGRSRSWPLVAVALVGSGAWIGYAVSTAHAHWEGLRYVGTVERISAQTAFALAVAALPPIAGLGWLSIRLPVWTACIAGAGFGVFATLYPDQLRSPGAAWGTAAIIWSVATIAVAEATLWRRTTRADPSRSGLLHAQVTGFLSRFAYAG
jgi:hypothetical protein